MIHEITRNYLRNTNAHFFFGTFISDSSITGAGPDMPPSFRMRQKWTAIKIDATSGMPMQCQMYARSKAFASTIDPPSKPKRTSLRRQTELRPKWPFITKQRRRARHVCSHGNRPESELIIGQQISGERKQKRQHQQHDAHAPV